MRAVRPSPRRSLLRYIFAAPVWARPAVVPILCLTPDAGRGRLPQVALIRLRCSAHAAATRVPCLPGGAAQPLLCNVVRTLPGVLLHARACNRRRIASAPRLSVGATRTKSKRQRKRECLHDVCFYEPAAPGCLLLSGFAELQKKSHHTQRSAASSRAARERASCATALYDLSIFWRETVAAQLMQTKACCTL